MENKICCVSHDCDKCKAQAENNAELLRTVRAQAEEIEAAKAELEKYKTAHVCNAETITCINDENIQLRAEIQVLRDDNDRLKRDIEGLESTPFSEEAYEILQGKNKALEAKLSAIQSHEPVAWIVYAKGSQRYCTLTFDLIKVPEIYIGGDAFPLYARPAQPVAPVAPQQEPRFEWTVFNGAGAVVIENITKASALEYLSEERIARGWNAVGCEVIDTVEKLNQAQPIAQPAKAIELTNDDVRAVGGIVHRDGNVFFTNVALLNKAIATAKGKS